MAPSLCRACGTVIPGASCPHCGASPPTSASSTRLAALAVLGLGLAGCADGSGPVEALYGVPVMDEDGDGWATPEDCNDSDDSIHPGADETPGDSIDSNCDGQDDPVEDTDDA